jgi:hypothetical protein
MSEAATLTGNNIETKFKIGLNNLSSIHAVADVENVDIEIFVATV